MNNEVKEMLAAVGSLAEMAGFYRDQLLKQGFTREEAIKIVREWLINMMKLTQTEED